MHKRNSPGPMLLAAVFLVTATISNAQSVTGSWIKTNEVLVRQGGKTVSTLQMLVKNMPCFADIIYSFAADGKMSENAKNCSPLLQKQIAGSLENARWKFTGNKLFIDSPGGASPVKHAEYRVQFT